MKKGFFLLLVILSCTINAQRKNKANIMTTDDIPTIEEYLKNAHPDDPKKIVLKSKLIALKNKKWTEGAKDAKPMEARPIVTEIPNNVMKNPESDEAEEFKRLMANSSEAHKDKTVKLLNTLFDQDINRKEAIILVQNNSDCNMILRIHGDKEFFNLAVPRKGENSIVLNKGNYKINGNMCGAVYNTTKQVNKSMVIVLNSPEVLPKSTK